LLKGFSLQSRKSTNIKKKKMILLFNKIFHRMSNN
jgi:hypothetical protein